MQEVLTSPEQNEKLKRLTRRRQLLVEEKVRIINRMQSDILAVSPGLLEITGSADNKWFLSFLTAKEDLRQLSRITSKGVSKISGIGARYASSIKTWQKTAFFSAEVEL